MRKQKAFLAILLVLVLVCSYAWAFPSRKTEVQQLQIQEESLPQEPLKESAQKLPPSKSLLESSKEEPTASTADSGDILVQSLSEDTLIALIQEKADHIISANQSASQYAEDLAAENRKLIINLNEAIVEKERISTLLKEERGFHTILMADMAMGMNDSFPTIMAGGSFGFRWRSLIAKAGVLYDFKNISQPDFKPNLDNIVGTFSVGIEF